MSKYVGTLFMLLAGCAAGGTRLDRETSPHARLRLEPASPTEVSSAFPVVNDPRLPSADQMSRVILDELGPVASAEVRVCVAADGHVQEVNLVRSSSLVQFDRALLRDMTDWQFSGTPGSSALASTLHTCEDATITYRPHQ
jgi:TonB family protein